jgi:hypothetical protein
MKLVLKKIVILFLHWFISWCLLPESILGIVTFGFYKPAIGLWAAENYTRHLSGIPMRLKRNNKK